MWVKPCNLLPAVPYSADIGVTEVRRLLYRGRQDAFGCDVGASRPLPRPTKSSAHSQEILWSRRKNTAESLAREKDSVWYLTALGNGGRMSESHEWRQLRSKRAVWVLPRETDRRLETWGENFQPPAIIRAERVLDSLSTSTTISQTIAQRISPRYYARCHTGERRLRRGPQVRPPREDRDTRKATALK